MAALLLTGSGKVVVAIELAAGEPSCEYPFVFANL